MKWIKIDGEYFNANSIHRIVPIKEGFARIHFIADKRIDVTQETLQQILDFTQSEAIEIEETKIPETA